MTQALHLKYRPTTLDDVVGNKSAIDSIKSIMSRKDGIPHSFLFSGPSGCGKTTIARIIKNQLGCSDLDFRELNSANVRGIDSIRELVEDAAYYPHQGSIKMFLLDECFASGTIVSTPLGKRKIETVQVGDIVYNMTGKCKVKNVFKNKVATDRVVKVKLSEGPDIVCSKDHLFFTEFGWEKAIDLDKNIFIFSRKSDIMNSNRSPLEAKKDEDMRDMFGRVQRAKGYSTHMFQTLRTEIKEQRSRVGYYCKKALRMVREFNNLFCDSQKESEKILFQQMCLCMEGSSLSSYMYGGNCVEDQQFPFESFYRNKRKIIQRTLTTDEDKESISRSNDYRERESDEKNQGHFAYLVWRTWREWKDTACSIFVGKRVRMADGSSCQNILKFKGKEWLSHLLQGRYRKRDFETCNRGRRDWASIERKYVARSEKDDQIDRIRVDSVEVYKQGNNDGSFVGIIGDTEKNQGYVEFYDLEIDGHPSYYANGCLVHNCHKLTNDAQNALLKLLEDTPDYVYLILCTTDPEKLIKAVRTRCTTFQVQSLLGWDIKLLLKNVLEKEKINNFPSAALDEICKVCGGSPRQALVILDSVIDIQDDDELINAVVDYSFNEKTVVDLCKALLEKHDWKTIAPILKVLLTKDEGEKDTDKVEKMRYAILGYMNAVLLNSGNKDAAIIMEGFLDSFIQSGKAGFTYACYMAAH